MSNSPFRRFRRVPVLVWLVLSASPALAGAPKATAPVPETLVLPSSGTLNCDYLEFRSTENVIHARGHAVMVSSGVRIEADDIEIDMTQKRAKAHGHVYLNDGLVSLYGERGDFNWERSTGTLYDAYIEDKPWRMWGKEIVRVSPELYRVRRAAVTTCDVDPPHYHFRGRFMNYRPKKRATVYSSSMRADDAPLFYTPLYTHSLKKRRWTLRVDPGQNGRDGIFVKSILGYPVSKNTYGRLYWDHFQRTGNGLGAEYDYYRPDVKGTLYGYRIDDRISKTERWNFRAGHWQQLKPRWSLQANAAFQSDSDFNNLFFRDDYERVKQKAESDGAVTYQNPRYTARVAVEQDQVFNPARGKFVRQKTTLPQLSVQSSPLRLGRSNLYSTLSGSLRNEYDRPEFAPPSADPLLPERDRFRQTGDASANLSQRIQVTKSITVKPTVGVSENWQSWRTAGLASIDRKDLYQGRGFTQLNLRQRVTKSLDYDITHDYKVRWTPNQFKRDHSSVVDAGMESNSISTFLSFRPGRRFWARASSGYDLRKLPGETIESVRQKITPPTFEVNLTPARYVTFFYRESFLLYPERRPQISQFSAQVGRSDKTHFLSGYSYNVGVPHAIQVRHGLAFHLTKGWWLDGGLQYNVSGKRKTNYDSVQIIEKSLIVKRDLHCWTAQAEVKERPGVREVFFRIDLKSNVDARKELSSPDERQFYPAREVEEGGKDE